MVAPPPKKNLHRAHTAATAPPLGTLKGEHFYVVWAGEPRHHLRAAPANCLYRSISPQNTQSCSLHCTLKQGITILHTSTSNTT